MKVKIFIVINYFSLELTQWFKGCGKGHRMKRYKKWVINQMWKEKFRKILKYPFSTMEQNGK